MNDDISPRLTAMREALITDVASTGTASTTGRRRPTRGAVVAVVAAFLVGGTMTGGLTAAALPGNDPDTAIQASLATTTRYMVEDANHGRVVGTPSFRVARGDTALTLSDRPAGADSVTVAWACLDGDAPTVEVDGHRTEGTLCGRRDDPTSEATGWALSPMASTGATVVTLSADDTDRYAVWVSWAKAPSIATPSPQQDAETADGAVTLDEYRTAFNRLLACQAQAGQPMGDVPLTWYADGAWNGSGRGTGPWYLYATPAAGSEVFDMQCYPREFDAVDRIWQEEHPEPEDPPVEPAVG
ncbi:hypothetical protein [Curtobacterium sp. MCPF17_046]|uniref:hypothetical protein n=1 Tax=Curtobacterium sp. MCPF17_046 TaxID=2175663 RepID=UPI000D975D0A|nr:hypothetical protein [Curtobacterium sp. MCPF17_046]PYY39609.1 hypothetical protein DEJ32_07370 [Curtobacterium sp. MCPF17_046]